MRRAAEANNGPPAKHHKADPTIPHTRHVLKVLLPSEVVLGLLGVKGANKDQIQSETGTKLVFSNREDYYPGSRHRVLGIFSDEMTNIDAALEAVIHKLIEFAEDGSKKGDGKGEEPWTAKEAGQYIFRLCISSSAASALIGSGGTNIAQVRSESGSKVFIDNDKHLGHQLVRVIGGQQEIQRALVLLNEYVQAKCDKEDFFSSYAAVINFGALSGEDNGSSPQAAAWEPKGKGGKGNKGGKEDHNGDRGRRKGGGKGDKNGWKEDSHSSRQGGGKGKAYEAALQNGLDLLADKIRELPAHTLPLPYALDCKVPGYLLETLQAFAASEVAEAMPDVNFTFETEPDANGECPVQVAGAAPWLYAAHAAMMQRIAALKGEEEDARLAQERPSAEDPEALKRQIAELQNQLKSAKSSKR